MKQGKVQRRRPSAALVVSMTALVMSISGVAVALPGTNTVNSGDIVNETVRGKDIRDGTIATSDIADSTIITSDIADGGVNAFDIAANAVGASELSTSGVTQGTQAQSAENSTNQKTVTASCASGSVAIGASVLTFDTESGAAVDKEVAITDSFLSSQNSGRDWVVSASETDDIGETWQLVVRPICFG